VNIPSERKTHYLAPKVGHYGVFNGSRFRADIAPRISEFIYAHDARSTTRPRSDPASVVLPLVRRGGAH
jgi:poly(3-hydroxybutyrate) depolymerase